MQEKHHIRYALLFGLIASVCYALNSTLGKVATLDASPFYLLFFRFFMGLVLVLPFIRKSDKVFSIPSPGSMICFAFLSIISFTFVLLALRQIPVANVVTLTLIYPLILPLIVRGYFKTLVPHTIYIGIVIGFIGILVLMDPSAKDFKLVPSLFALGSGLSIALIFIFVRRMGKSISSNKIMFDLYLLSIAVTFIPMLLTWKIPSTHCILAIFGMAITGNLYQISVNLALKKASSVVVAPMMFFSVVVGMLADYFIWGTHPSLMMLLGSLLIFIGVVITCIINYRHAHHLS
jgi:drug/metabolite transporter (DMT)-like permease